MDEQLQFLEELVRTIFRKAMTRQDDEILSTGESPHTTEQSANKTTTARRIVEDLVPFETLCYDDAFLQQCGTRVLHMTASELKALADTHRVAPPLGLDADDRDGWLNLLLAELIEPRFGFDRPVFLRDYPASQAALAKIRDDVPTVAERFELYIEGIELCNGYVELTDVDELRRRIVEQNKARVRNGRRSLPEQSRLLDAMDAGLPESTGVALGFDRLVMLALDKKSLADVIAFPFNRA